MKIDKSKVFDKKQSCVNIMTGKCYIPFSRQYRKCKERGYNTFIGEGGIMM
jgi:hypothetical protein